MNVKSDTLLSIKPQRVYSELSFEKNHICGVELQVMWCVCVLPRLAAHDPDKPCLAKVTEGPDKPPSFFLPVTTKGNYHNVYMIAVAMRSCDSERWTETLRITSGCLSRRTIPSRGRPNDLTW